MYPEYQFVSFRLESVDNLNRIFFFLSNQVAKIDQQYNHIAVFSFLLSSFSSTMYIFTVMLSCELYSRHLMIVQSRHVVALNVFRLDTAIKVS